MKRKIGLLTLGLLLSITGMAEMKRTADVLGNEQGLVIVESRWSQKPHLLVKTRLQVRVPFLVRENKKKTTSYEGSVSIPQPAPFDLYVVLQSSNPLKVKLPPYITIAAGQKKATFSIRVSPLGLSKESIVIKTVASGYASSSVKLLFPKRRRLVFHKAPQKNGNLIVNGDFERGNCGFSSTYRLSSQGVGEGVYYVGSSSKAWNHYFSYNVKDHTTESGLMLLGNGKINSTSVWAQTVKIKKGETYQFSGWTSSLSKTVHAKLEFSVGGEVFKTVTLKKRWEPFSVQWKSPLSGTVVLSIRDLNTESIGNDFALDDLYFGPSESLKDDLAREIRLLASKTDSSLIASYPFNGSADDVSGNGHNGIVHGATLTTDRFGNPNSAYYFDGKNDYISIPDRPDFTVTDTTVCAWIRTRDRSNEKHITSCYGRNISSEWYHLYVDSETGAGCWQVDPGGQKIPPRIVGNRMIADGEWHFLVGVRDTSSKHLKIYMDGVLQSMVWDHSTKPLNPEVDFWIGGQNTFPQRFFNGEIDDVSVYKRALSSEEILNMYNKNKGLELIAHYSFDGNANDVSGNGHNGVVHGATLTTDRFGNPNSAYRFDGENDYIRVSDAEALRLSDSNFSIGIWFKEYARNHSYQSVLLAKRGLGSNNGWIFSTQGNQRGNREGQLYYQVSGGLAPWCQSDQSLELNEWHYAVLTYKRERQELRVYMDGVLNSVCSNVPPPSAKSNSDLFIGRDSSSSSYYFNGVIDDVSIYKGILSESKIAKEYAGQGLLAYFSFNGNANDVSGNGHNGIVHGATLTTDRFGKPNSAYHFNGNSSFIDCGNIITNVAQFTVSAWVKVDRFTDSNYMGPWSQQSFSVPLANCNYHMYTGNSGNNCFGISMAWADGADCTLRSGHVLPIREWRLITQTYDGKQYRLYDNGNLITQQRMLNHRLISKERFLIGKTCAYPSNTEKTFYFAGAIDDLRIYNRALSVREIKHLLEPQNNVDMKVKTIFPESQALNQQIQIFSGSPKSRVKPLARLTRITIRINEYGEVTMGNTTYSKQNPLADLVQKLTEKREQAAQSTRILSVKISAEQSAPHAVVKKVVNACKEAGIKNMVFAATEDKKHRIRINPPQSHSQQIKGKTIEFR